jgi:hypothetical protein
LSQDLCHEECPLLGDRTEWDFSFCNHPDGKVGLRTKKFQQGYHSIQHDKCLYGDDGLLPLLDSINAKLEEIANRP